MNEQAFVQKREPDWRRLTALCDKADASAARLSPAELREMVRLYRRASSDLALVRTRSGNVGLVEFLNSLAGRAYGILYRAPRKPLGKAIGDAVALAAQTVRRRRWFVLVSALLFIGPALGTFFLMRVVPDAKEFFIPEGFEDAFQGWKSGRFEERTASESSMMTGFYASNNPRASMATGAIGAATFGIGSVWLLATNGALLGVLAHEVAPLGHLDFLLSSIAPHGVPELSGIIVAGTSGLLLGYALINPGRRRRGDALREVGGDAIVLLTTSIVMMFIAAPIEGFFSFNPAVPGWLKVIVATISAVAWAMFWIGYGRTEKEGPSGP